MTLSRCLCLLVSLVTLFHHSTAPGEDNGEDSSGTGWKDVNVLTDEWKGIKAFLGMDLCAGNQLVCKNNFTGFVGRATNVTQAAWYGLIGVCETDKNLKKAVVCWVRHKPKLNNQAQDTLVEAQFWSDHPGMSHCRYARPH
ncbi:hypothetical protein WDU94_000237 [Cyamophila willieti]